MKNLTKSDLEQLYSHDNLVKVYNWKIEGRFEDIVQFVKDFTDAKVMSSNLRSLIRDLVDTALNRIGGESNEVEEDDDEELMSDLRLKCDVHYFLEEIKDIIYSEVRRDTYDEICNKIKDFERDHL